ncbi:MAG: Rrf2 family transcriptional regulator [Planctomycetes bacterium]|nr:Rrf2 family transcriptional regulator [Planctomycetota bacterium]
MEISRETDYAVRALIDVARFSKGPRLLTRDIATRELVPFSLLVKIMARLSKAGLVGTRRGQGGGVYLLKDPETISMLEVVETMEGPIGLNRCVLHPEACSMSGHCAAHRVWQAAQELVANHLGSVSIGQLARQTEDLRCSKEAVQRVPVSYPTGKEKT